MAKALAPQPPHDDAHCAFKTGPTYCHMLKHHYSCLAHPLYELDQVRNPLTHAQTYVKIIANLGFK